MTKITKCLRNKKVEGSDVCRKMSHLSVPKKIKPNFFIYFCNPKIKSDLNEGGGQRKALLYMFVFFI